MRRWGWICAAAVLCLALFLASSSSADVLYVDEQFGFSRSTEVFASKPVGSPPSNLDLELELFQPVGTGVPASRPAIILIHGGGFTGGNRFNGRLIEMCERMARRGYTCVSIDYRLYGDAPVIEAAFTPIEAAVAATGDPRATAIAAAAEDGWASYLWMTTNAATLGIDVGKIGVGGSSAGAVTALLLGYTLDDLGVAPSDAFKAVFDMWGSLGDEPTSLDADDPPLLIAHGEDDATVPVSGALALEARAVSVGLPYEIHIEEGVGHGFNIFTREVGAGQTMFDRFVDFFAYYVAESPASTAVPALNPIAFVVLSGILFAIGFTAVSKSRRS